MDPLPEEDHRNSPTPATIRDLFNILHGYAPDREIQIRLCGTRVLKFDLDPEDIHLEEGKVFFCIGSSRPIHLDPLDLDEIP